MMPEGYVLCPRCGAEAVVADAPPLRRGHPIEPLRALEISEEVAASLSPAAALRRLGHLVVREGTEVVELQGDEGSGREDVVKEFVDRWRSELIGPVVFARWNAYDRSFGAEVEKIRRSNGTALVILEGYDVHHAERLPIQRRDARLLLLPDPGDSADFVANRLYLHPSAFTEWRRQLYAAGGRTDVSLYQLADIFAYSDANWRKALQGWPKVLLRRLPGLLDGLQPFSAPGLVGPDGQPLTSGSASSKPLVASIQSAATALIERIAREPDAIFELSGRLFEELVCELLARRGFEVELTPATRDGGKDIYAARNDDLGAFLWIVECKRYARHRSVGIGVLQRLHGVVMAEQATGGVVATTSFFSRDARRFQASVEKQLNLRDYNDLQRWVQESWSAA